MQIFIVEMCRLFEMFFLGLIFRHVNGRRRNALRLYERKPTLFHKNLPHHFLIPQKTLTFVFFRI